MASTGSGLGPFGKRGMHQMYNHHIAPKLTSKNRAIVALASKSLYDARNAEANKTMRTEQAAYKTRSAVDADARKLAATFYRVAADMRRSGGNQYPKAKSQTWQRVKIGRFTAEVDISSIDDEATFMVAFYEKQTMLGVDGYLTVYKKTDGRYLVGHGYWRHAIEWEAGVPKATRVYLNAVYKRAIQLYNAQPVRHT